MWVKKKFEKGHIVHEHHWFALTTLGINAFFLVTDFEEPKLFIARILSTLVSTIAFFLIVQRAAMHEDQISYPKWLAEMEKGQKRFYHKALETLCHLLQFPKFLLFVVCEFSGAFFYGVLVVISCIGVWLR